MPSATTPHSTPGLSSFLKSTKTNSIDSSIELLVSLLQRRQIKNSRQCALATAQLLLRVIAAERVRDAQALIKRVRSVGRRLVAAQPREMAAGNIVRRVLGIIREVGEESQAQEPEGSEIGSPPRPAAPSFRPALNTTISSFSPLHHGSALPANLHSHRGDDSGASTPLYQSFSDLALAADPFLQQRPGLAAASSTYVGSLFELFQQPAGSALSTPPTTGQTTPVKASLSSPRRPGPGTETAEKLDIKAEIIDGIKELLDELEVVDSQIAESALDHIHENEIVLTHTSSQTVQRFLSTAARKRKFTVVVAEAFPNDHAATHATVVNGGMKVGADVEEVRMPSALYQLLSLSHSLER
jgi:translation initiation factor eIF-2B subunit beta